MLVSGGYSDIGLLSNTELIDLCPEDGTTCPQPDDFPVGVCCGPSLRSQAQNPLFCGGSHLNFRNCYEYNPESFLWVPGPTFIEERNFSPQVELRNNSFWVLSGIKSPYTTELLVENNFVEGPDITGTIESTEQCACQVTDDITFFGDAKGYIFDAVTGQFTETNTPMPSIVKSGFCGAATLPDGSRVVVRAGGYATSSITEESHMYNLSDGTWSRGPDLPNALARAQVVQMADTFLVVGGSGNSGVSYSDKIFEFDPVNLAWIEKEQRLNIGRDRHYVAKVEKSRYCA